jgi:hypothetical protein
MDDDLEEMDVLLDDFVDMLKRTSRWKDHFKSDFRSDQDHLLEK